MAIVACIDQQRQALGALAAALRIILIAITGLGAMPHLARVYAEAEGANAPIRQTWRELIRRHQDPRAAMDTAIRYCDGMEHIQRGLTWQHRQQLTERPSNPWHVPPVHAGQDNEIRMLVGQHRQAAIAADNPAPPVQPTAAQAMHPDALAARGLIGQINQRRTSTGHAPKPQAPSQYSSPTASPMPPEHQHNHGNSMGPGM